MIKKKQQLNTIPTYANILLNIFFIIIMLLCIYPVVLILGISLTSQADIAKHGYSLFPNSINIQAYKIMMESKDQLLSAYGVTIFATAIGTILTTILTALYAYPLSRREFRYKKFFTFFIFFTMLFNGGLVPWYIVVTKVTHLQDTIWVLILPYIMNAFYVIIMRTFFMTTVPNEIIESARIDGAGELRTFISIVLPISKPALATIALFATLTYWNDYFLPLMFITKSQLFNLQFLMYKFLMNIAFMQSSTNPEVANKVKDIPSESIRMAYAIFSVGPIIIAYPFFQKYFVKGLTIGAVKG